MDEGLKEHMANLELVKKRRELSEQKKLERSKKKLEGSIIGKMETIMVGALAAIEELFQDSVEGSPETYEKLRDRILTHANNQIRKIKKELELYEIEFKGYQMQFRVIGSGGQNG